MPKEYSKEKFWKLYDTLPQELKDALFAEETSNSIEEICKKFEVEEVSSGIVEAVGQVLLGVLSPANFRESLEKDLRIDPEKSKKIDQEIFRTIFYPVKPALELVGKATGATITEIPVEKENIATLKTEETTPGSKGPDSYREPIE